MRVRFTRFVVVASVLLLPLLAEAQDRHFHGQPDEAGGVFVIAEVDGKAACRVATPDEAVMINMPITVPLKVFGEDRARVRANHEGEQHGLNIVLRGTTQLDANPEAKAAFERAAEILEARIASPITVIVDVDYGANRFGTPYPSANIIGSTNSRGYLSNPEEPFDALRADIIARADNATERTVYNALPGGGVPTEDGPVTRWGAVAALLRVFGEFPADANDDPAAEAEFRRPNIGFNSAFSFDFDPTDGIAAGKTDFIGVAVHEMGHLLGFVSRVGVKEVNATATVGPSILDLFRFRPGVTLDTFGTANRVLVTGGEQVYFGGGASFALSTGNPSGENGDGNQASHWKDDSQSGTQIGIMDPTIPRGRREELTKYDLEAFDMMGYELKELSGCSEMEPNNNGTDANAMPFETPCTGITGLNETWKLWVPFSKGSTGRLHDFFQVTLPSPAKLNIAMTFANDQADLDLFLVTTDGTNATTVASSVGETTSEQFETGTLAAGTYYVVISAFKGTSAYSVTTRAIGLLPPRPHAPSSLTATATSASAVRLRWVDNAANETEFRIEQKIGGAFTEIATVPANVTTFDVSGLAALSTSTYRVRARNEGGDSDYTSEASATTGGGTGTCVADANTVCLLDGRFKVVINYLNQFANPPQPGKLLAQRLLAGVQNPDTAIFGFGSPTAIEVVVRIQDTRPFGAQRFDIYYGGMTDVEYTVTIIDTVTGTTRQYRNPPGVVGGGVDRASFPSNGGPTPVYALVQGAATPSVPIVAPNAPGACVPGADTICLLDGRFKVKIDYLNQFANPPQPGTLLGAKLLPGSQNPDTGIFGFGSPEAIEAVVRIQDARPFGAPRFDIYFGGMTDVEYTVTVTDTVTGTTRRYRKGPGSVAGGVDRSSFVAQ